MHRWLEKRMEESGDDDTYKQAEPLLASCYSVSIRYLTALGQRTGQPLMRVFSAIENEGPSERELRTVAGSNLHVSIPIQGDDRRGLERQLRYMGRPPLSKERLTKTADGRIVVKLKSFWSDGTSHIVLTHHEFMERLVALLPPPRKNQIRYSGVFASNSKLRKRFVPKKEEEQGVIPTECRYPTSKSSRKHSSWAKFMARVFGIDVLACPRCKSKLQVLSFIPTRGTRYRAGCC